MHNAPDALRLKLVTKLGYFDEVQDYMRGKLGLAKDKKPSLVSLSDYVDDNDRRQGRQHQRQPHCRDLRRGRHRDRQGLRRQHRQRPSLPKPSARPGSTTK